MGEREAERFMPCSHWHIEMGEQVQVGGNQAMVMSMPGLMWRNVPGFRALMQQKFLLMSIAPDTTKGRKDRAVQNWPHPSPTATLGRTGPAPYQLNHSGKRVLYVTGAAQ